MEVEEGSESRAALIWFEHSGEGTKTGTERSPDDLEDDRTGDLI